MENPTLSTILQEARRLGLAEALEELEYHTTSDPRKGRMHLSTGLGTACGSSSTYRSGRVPLARLRSRKDRCTRCVGSLGEAPGRLPRTPTWELLNVIGYLISQRGLVTTLGQGPVTRGLETSVYAHQSLNRFRVDLRDSEQPGGALEPLLTHAHAEAARLQDALETQLRRPEVKVELQRIARVRLGLAPEPPEAEEETLVAWSKPRALMLHSGQYTSSTWKVLLSWDAKERPDKRVTHLVVPRSVGEWLQVLSENVGGYQTRAHVAPAPRDPRELETALALWEPRSNGALGALDDALAAARGVHAAR